MYIRFEYNKDEARRKEIIGYEDSPYGLYYFNDMDVSTLKQLIDERFIDPEECQNSSPSTNAFYELMSEYPEFKAHGYAVPLERDDYRVTIEGIEGIAKSDEAIQAFFNLCRDADECDMSFITKHCRSWWD